MDEDDSEAAYSGVFLHGGADVGHLYLEHVLVVEASGVGQQGFDVEVDFEYVG